MRLAVVLLVSTALVTPARAAGADDEERARGHYEIGLGLYRLGDYHGALKEFAAGYELARKPGFLLNLGQTYRKLGELREARDLYRQFLAESRADDPARPEARKVLAELEQAIRKHPPPEPAIPPPSRTTPPPAPSNAPTTTAPTTTAPRTTAPMTTAPTTTAPSSPAASGRLVEPTTAGEPPPAEPAASAASPAAPPVTVHAAAPHRARRSLRIAGIAVGIVGVGLIGGGIGSAVAADGIARDLNSTDRAGGVFDPAQDHAYAVDRDLSAGLFAGGAALAATGAVLLIVSAR